jgi:predicted amidophosphoribosyltransferase
MRCPECGYEITNDVTVCPQCGYEIAYLKSDNEHQKSGMPFYKNHKYIGILYYVLLLASALL